MHSEFACAGKRGAIRLDKRLSVRGMDVQEYLLDPTRKQQYVTTVFEIVASSYDHFTRVCSFGRDRAWKRQLIGWLKPRLLPHHHVLDVATGTGDFAIALADAVPQGHVLGLDISENMIARARAAAAAGGHDQVTFEVGDMMQLPLPAGSVDAITVGYGLRNCPDAAGALREMARVLKPGGYLAVLEFVRPEQRWWGALFRRGLLAACQFFGWLWHREPAVYGYLAHSLSHWLSRSELIQAMQQSDFELIQLRGKMVGTVCVLLARRGPPH